jgi:hypothetical protein
LVIGCSSGSGISFGDAGIDGSPEPEPTPDVPDASSDAVTAADVDVPSDGGTDVGGTCTPRLTEERACGRCGRQVRICNTDATWSDWSVCGNETGACTPGASESEPCASGGQRSRTCGATCEWDPFGACKVDECVTGGRQEEPCGACGKRTRSCVSGAWQSWSACGGEGVCAAGSKQSEACPGGTQRERTCTSACAWPSWPACPTPTAQRPADDLWVVRITPDPAPSFPGVTATIDRVGIDRPATGGSMTIPSTTSPARVVLSSSDLAGHLQRSADGRYVVLGGFDAAPGTTGLDGGSYPIRIARIAAGGTGTIDTVAAMTFPSVGTSGWVNAAATPDGREIFVIGPRGLHRFTRSTTTPTGTLIDGSTGAVTIAESGALFSTSAAGVRFWSSAASANSTNGTAIISGANGYAIVALATATSGVVDLVYLARETDGVPEIVRYQSSGGVWSRTGAISFGALRGERLRHLTGWFRGPDAVLYGTLKSGSVSTVVTLTDRGLSSTSATIATLATAPAGQEYRGIAFAPR